MKASGSVLCSALAAAYLVFHLPFLAPSPEDIDSINFALGLTDFDVARHQPHPPGYPVYIALGRLSLSAVHLVAPGLDVVRADALALAVWSAIAGAIALLAAFAFFQALERTDAAAPAGSGVPLAASALLAVAPLFWIGGLRPMSDLPGLALALSAQALALRSWSTGRYLAAAAFVAGLAVGLRVQTIWLTLPLLLLVWLRHRQLGVGWTMTRPVAALAAGGAVWAIPLVVASGGPAAYMRALGSQAGEDFAWVDMLWANPTPRRLAFALYETFVMPWDVLVLASVVGAAAAIGFVVAARRAPRALALLAVSFGPYVLFHLLFQETLHVRYALPAVPALAWLAVNGLWVTGRVAPVLTGVLCLSAATTSVPMMTAYAREAHPAFRAIADMTAAAAAEQPAAVYSHYALRRPLQLQAPAGVMVVEPPRASEWADLVAYWRNGGDRPVWFLADPRRTDLALVDPQSRRNVQPYRWAVADRPAFGGTRPLGVDWYRFDRPGWFAGEGWSLTPELGGVTRATGNGVDRRPIEALIRRRPDPMIAIIGARHLGAAADGGVTFTVTIDGRTVDQWTLDPAAGPNSLRVMILPAGSLDGEGVYARLVIAASPVAGGGATPAVAIRQFDVQPATGLVHAFDEGWHEEEYDNVTGVRWRWSSGRSIVRVLPPQAVQLRLRGESPLKYFDAPPTLRVTAGGRVVAELHPNDDFEWTVTIPAEDVRRADGRIALETSPVYLPGRAEGTSDARELGVRLFDIDVLQSRPD
jgi:hypothetical protein